MTLYLRSDSPVHIPSLKHELGFIDPSGNAKTLIKGQCLMKGHDRTEK